MANRIVIGAASLLGGSSYLQIQVQSLENGVLQTDKYISFNANEFECIYDNQQPNIVVFHFGRNHTVTVSNADYQEFYQVGVSKATPVALAVAVLGDIAGYTS